MVEMVRQLGDEAAAEYMNSLFAMRDRYQLLTETLQAAGIG